MEKGKDDGDYKLPPIVKEPYKKKDLEDLKMKN